MPELPEVETIRRALDVHLSGCKLERVLVRENRLRWPVDEGKMECLAGCRILAVTRRAKYLLFNLKDYRLIIHLGMSGRLLYLNSEQPFEKHDHVLFYFEDGSELRFRDPRRFGMVDVFPTTALRTYPRLIHLGLEPLASSTRAVALFNRARKLKRPIKNLLMDATFIVGVGNIYASEALFHARIHPQTPAGCLSEQHWRTLLRQVRRVLRKAIEKGGTTLNDFVNSNGETGYFQLSLAVYGREGEPCERCQSKIRRIVQVGRSSFFCPECQSH